MIFLTVEKVADRPVPSSKPEPQIGRGHPDKARAMGTKHT